MKAAQILAKHLTHSEPTWGGCSSRNNGSFSMQNKDYSNTAVSCSKTVVLVNVNQSLSHYVCWFVFK